MNTSYEVTKTTRQYAQQGLLSLLQNGGQSWEVQEEVSFLCVSIMLTSTMYISHRFIFFN